MVSILIPSRNEKYLINTINDILLKATGNFEIIVILDGYIEPQLKPSKNLKIIYHKEPLGTRKSINEAIKLAKGEYIFKTDAHCMFSEGFDQILSRDYEKGTVTTLSRYSLDPDTWTKFKGPISYEYIAYPFDGRKRIGGLTPKKWVGPNGNDSNDLFWMEKQRRNILIDEIQTCNGACWFLEKKLFEEFGGMDERLWSFHIDAVELGFKAWLSGGKLLINKNAWHAHWWKSEKKRTVKLNWDVMGSVAAYSTWYWMNDQWPKQKRSFEWFIEKFWPIPGWPDNWRAERDRFEKPILIEASA
jgi:glycosyltransferase involved in cell wall biosynthesis